MNLSSNFGFQSAKAPIRAVLITKRRSVGVYGNGTETVLGLKCVRRRGMKASMNHEHVRRVGEVKQVSGRAGAREVTPCFVLHLG